MDKPQFTFSVQTATLYTRMNYNLNLMHCLCLVRTGFLTAGGFVHTALKWNFTSTQEIAEALNTISK